MTTSERAITKQITEYLRTVESAFTFKVHGGPMQQAGVPDLLVCYRGRFYAFEIKQEGKKPTRLQERRMEQIRQAGGIAAVVRSVDDVREVLNARD